MSLYRLSSQLVFPPAERADEYGLLAYGGDLSVERLLEAYKRGIFPWSEEGEPLLWWCPDPRLILEPEDLKISRSLRAVLRKGTFEVRFDTAFAGVIHACAVANRPGEEGTWITQGIERAYTKLHELGYAHSVESWSQGALLGGLYGVCLGRCFYGESMFSLRGDASKVALVALVDYLREQEIRLIDCQVSTEHLRSLGAKEIPRAEFLGRLNEALQYPTMQGKWSLRPFAPG